MALMPFLRVSAGIHAKVDPVRLRYDPETGVQLLAQAVNVDVDQAGRISRRKGLRRINSVTGIHSLWSTADQSQGFLIAGDTLYSLQIDGSLSLIKNGLQPGAAGYFCEVGPDIYFSNGYQKGILRGGVTWSDWESTPYTGPDTTRVFSGPPSGTRLAFYRGRILIGSDQDQCVWYSEPLNYGCFDLARNYTLFGGDILMVFPLQDGIYVSSDKAVYFLAGHTPDEFEVRKVLESPVVNGTEVGMRAEWVNADLQGPAVCFVVQDQGVCLGLNNGTILYLTKERVNLPRASSGVSVINHNDDFRYLTFMEI